MLRSGRFASPAATAVTRNGCFFSVLLTALAFSPLPPCLAMVGGTFELSKNASANLRQKNDHYNSAVGGFLAGSILGMKGTLAARVAGASTAGTRD